MFCVDDNDNNNNSQQQYCLSNEYFMLSCFVNNEHLNVPTLEDKTLPIKLMLNDSRRKFKRTCTQMSRITHSLRSTHYELLSLLLWRQLLVMVADSISHWKLNDCRIWIGMYEVLKWRHGALWWLRSRYYDADDEDNEIEDDEYDEGKKIVITSTWKIWTWKRQMTLLLTQGPEFLSIIFKWHDTPNAKNIYRKIRVCSLWLCLMRQRFQRKDTDTFDSSSNFEMLTVDIHALNGISPF